ncbi:MAG: hypothetical protein AAB802_04165 [Patescibacteria group bacterium]
MKLREINKVHLVTGAGEGPSVGNSAVQALLRNTGDRVVCVGRSDLDKTGYQEQERLHYMQMDLLADGSVDALVDELGSVMSDHNVKLGAVIASLGTGSLDEDLKNPELRKQQRLLNVVLPSDLAEKLLKEGLMDEKALFLYISALFTSEALQGMLNGVVDEFTKDKLAALDELKRIFDQYGKGKMVEVVMGEVMGKMMNKYMKGSPTGGLVTHAAPAWFMGLPANPNRKGGIGDQLARLAQGNADNTPDLVRMPTLAKLLGIMPAWLIKIIFPKILQSSAPAVAEYYGVTREDYDMCIGHHVAAQTHPGVDLVSARSDNWWSLAISRANAKGADWALGK